MRIRSITAPNPGPFTLTGTRSYLLGLTTVIDPGPVIESHIAALCGAMPALTTILVTHRHADHAPAARQLKLATGARVLAPRSVLDDTVVDVRIEDGDQLEIEGEIIAVIGTPGHTGEHVCFLTEQHELFSGDTILGSGTTTIFPPDGSMSDYLRSLKKLRALEPRRIHPAHGPDRDDPLELIDAYIAHRLDREGQLLAALRNGAGTIDSLRLLIYPDLGSELKEAAESQIAAHLTKLQQEERVVVDGDHYRLTFPLDGHS